MKQHFEYRNVNGSISIKLDGGKVWKADKFTLIKQIISVVENYADQGYTLTLRQLYYQLVQADYIPNNDKVYKKIGSILDDCRYAGLIDWEAIEDRGRVPYLPYQVEDLADALNDTYHGYRLDRQKGQPYHMEIWTEKDAISGILQPVARRFHIHLVVNKGYTSSSAMYRSYKRILEHINNDQPVKILYFGDHDPSGLDMIRDIQERISFMLYEGVELNGPKEGYWSWVNSDENYVRPDEFRYWLDDMGEEWYDKQQKAERDFYQLYWIHTMFKVIPIGLTMEQIKQYNPPPNPAKVTDPRAGNYVRQFGQVSWEVDALKPDVMVNIVENNVRKYLDFDEFKAVISQENSDKAKIKAIIDTP